MAVSNEEVNPKLPSWNGDWRAFESFELRAGLEVDSTKEGLICLDLALPRILLEKPLSGSRHLTVPSSRKMKEPNTWSPLFPEVWEVC